MQSSNIPAKFAAVFAAAAATGYIRIIPATSGDPTVASLALGFPPNTSVPVGAGGTPPNIADFNGILNPLSAWSQWLSAGGAFPPYDATFSAQVGGYPRGAVLAAAVTGNYWLSTVENNLTNPDTGGAGWLGATLFGGGQRGYLWGLTLSNDVSTPNTVYDISLGEARADDNSANLTAAAFTKSTAAWTAGSGSGSLDTGSLTNNTAYHIFIIRRPDTGIVDYLMSLSATAPTMPTNYTQKRRIGSLRTASAVDLTAIYPRQHPRTMRRGLQRPSAIFPGILLEPMRSIHNIASKRTRAAEFVRGPP
jgi:hypothetical protein